MRMLVALILMLFLPCAWALRCGSNVVTEGQRTYDVLQRCGDPTSIERRTELIATGFFGPPGFLQQQYVPVEIQEWLYDFGPHDLMQLLRFENGVLRQVRTLGYGRR